MKVKRWGPGRRGPGLFGLVFLISVAGCSSRRLGKVHGQVIYDKAPLPGGWVTFRPVDSRENSVPARIDEQGHYEAELPPGEALISVDNRELEPRQFRAPDLPSGLPAKVKQRLASQGVKPLKAAGPEKNAGKPAGRYKRIPSKYYQGDTSGLRITVAPGDQKYDIPLKKE